MSDSTPDHLASRGYTAQLAALSAVQLDAVRDTAQRLLADVGPAAEARVFSTRHRDADRDQYFLDSAEAVHHFLEEDAVRPDGTLDRPVDQAINKIGHALHDLVPEFTTFCRLPVFRDTLRDLGFGPAALWQTMLIFKQPEVGGEVRWHQDASYLNADGPGVIGCWVALEDADRDNGCLWVAPGQHRSPLRERYAVAPGASTGVLTTLDDTPWPSMEDAVPLEVPAGTVVWFSDHMPHMSLANRSPRSRLAFTMHFSRADANWAEDNWLQRRTLPPFIV